LAGADGEVAVELSVLVVAAGVVAASRGVLAQPSVKDIAIKAAVEVGRYIESILWSPRSVTP